MIIDGNRFFEISVEFSEHGLGLDIKNQGKSLSFPIDRVNLPRESIRSATFERIQEIENLWMEGLVDDFYGQSMVLYKSLYDIDNLEVLGINDAPLHVVIKTKGLVNQPSFTIQYHFKMNGKLILHERHQNILLSESGMTLIGVPLLDALNVIDQLGPSTSLDEKYAILAKIHALKEEPWIEFDRYLENNEYSEPDDIQPVFQEMGETIVVSSEMKSGSDRISLAQFKDGDRLLNISQGIKRKRIVFDQDTQTRVAEINRVGTLKGDDVPRFYENPIQFLSESVEIDLEEFSERVKGLKKRVYHSSPSVSIVNKGQGGWFDVQYGGVLVHPESGDRTPIDYDAFKELVETAKHEGREYVKHGDDWIKVDASTASTFIESVETTAPKHVQQENLRMVFDIFENISELEYSEEAQRLRIALPDDNVPYTEPPVGLQANLYDYQQIGYSWLQYNQKLKLGSLLADDMGLGKTIQLLAHITKSANNDMLKPSLVVLPKSLIENWIAEIKKFISIDFNTYIHLNADRSNNKEWIEDHDIVFTTYETLARDQLILGRIEWKQLILDEAQKIKNASTLTSIACKAMKVQQRVAVTGTPVENNLQELWSLIDFIEPGFLGSLSQFKSSYQLPIEKENSSETAESLIQKLKPVLLRRVKKDILKDLPEKHEKVVHVTMSPKQNQLYGRVLEEYHQAEKKNPLPTIQKLLMISAHPEQVSESFVLRDSKDLINDSGKLNEVISLLREIRSKGEKALIFTTFKNMQRILQFVLLDEFGINSMIINGEIHSNRLGIVDQFNQSPGFNCLILSPKAAGVGLNITGANHVIHFTREWNPAVENQATDRVYRIGQKKPVYVYYLVAVHDTLATVDVKLNNLLDLKRELFNNTIIPSEKMNIQVSDFGDF